jgi:putative spermidine/putrescine transport system ATP-binding protein
MNEYLRVKFVRKSFGAIEVIKGLNLDLAKGEFLTLLGPSGCGKSTLLRCVAGLESWDSGEIELEGEDLGPLKPQERGIGMVFQNYALFPTMRVIDNVSFGLRMKKLPQAEAHRRALEALDMVHLADRAKAFPHQLSGGMQQRVALARALVLRPRLLLLDEPLSALDAQIRKALRQEIRDLQKGLGMTTILVTHDQEEAFAVSDRICLMHDGRIIQAGRPEEIYAHPKHEMVARFLGNFNVFLQDEIDGWNLLRSSPDAARPTGGHGYAVAPEEIKLSACLAPSASGSEDLLWTSGKIEDMTHLGAIRRYHVAMEDRSITVDQLNDPCVPWLETGSKVYLSMRLETIREVERA